MMISNGTEKPFRQNPQQYPVEMKCLRSYRCGGSRRPPAPARPDSGAGAEGAGPAVRPLRILLVEDHSATRVAMQRLLGALGHRVTTAANVEGALAALAENDFDLLISDIGLPDGSGTDLMRRVREIRPLPAIAVSGYGMEEDVRRSERAGFAAHVTKPVDLCRLQAAIAMAIRETTAPPPDEPR